MIEQLIFRSLAEKEGDIVKYDIPEILHLERQSAELGAELVKTDPANDMDEYYRVVKTAGEKPVLVRGGSVAGVEEIIILHKN